MALTLFYYRTDTNQRYRGLASIRTRDLRHGFGGRNNGVTQNGTTEVSAPFRAGQTRNGFRCRYVTFKVIDPPYPDLLPNRYHSMIIWRPSTFSNFAANLDGWTWNGVPVRGLGVFEERVSG